MIKYDKLFSLLRKHGWTTYTIRTCGLIGQATLSKMKKGGHIDTRTIDKLCKELNCQPGDLMEYVPDE